MAYGTLVQFSPNGATGTDATASLPDPATAGNTLVAAFGHRSGEAAPNVAGYTQLADIRTLTSDTNNRRQLALYGKIAAGGETSAQADWTPNTNTAIVLAEFEGEADLTLVAANLADYLVSNDSGTTAVDTLGTGAVATHPAGALGIGVLVTRRGDILVQSWTNGMASVESAFTGTGTTQLEVELAAGLLDGTVDSTTATWSSGRPATATVALVVLPEAGGSPDPVDVTVAAVLPSLTAATAAEGSTAVEVDGVLASFVASAQAAGSSTADVAAGLPSFTASGTAEAVAETVAAAALPSFAASAEALAEASAVVAVTLPAFTADGVLESTATALAAASLPPFDAAAAGTVETPGLAADVTLPALQSSADLAASTEASVGAALPSLTATWTGVVETSGLSAPVVLPAFTAASEATVASGLTADVGLPSFTSSWSGIAGDVADPVNVTLAHTVEADRHGYTVDPDVPLLAHAVEADRHSFTVEADRHTYLVEAG